MTRRTLILVSLLLAAFVINLDTTMVNVALPALERELGATTTQLQWVVDAYNLVFAALLLSAGNLSDRLGRKRLLVAGLLVFGAASVAGSFATATGELIAARAVMGLGAALTFPSTLSLLTGTFTERRERARAIGLWGATAGAAIALGPIAGGWLLDQFSWSSIFVAMGPVAFAGAVLAMVVVPGSRGDDAGRLDTGGLVLSAGAIGVLVFTIIEAPAYGWGAARTIGGFVAAAALLVLFVLRESRSDVADDRRADLPEPALQRGQWRGDRIVLHAVRLHLPDHAVFPVPPRLQPAVHRRAPAAGGHGGGGRLGGGHPGGRPDRHEGGGGGRPAAHRGRSTSGPRPPRARR